MCSPHSFILDTSSPHEYVNPPIEQIFQAQIPNYIGFPTFTRKGCFESNATFCRKIFLNNNEILILHDVRELDFSKMRFYSDITALTAFNRNGSGIDGGLCQDKGVNDVLLES